MTDLPSGWALVQFGDLLAVQYGKSLPRDMRSSNGTIPVVGSSGIMAQTIKPLIHEPAIVVGRKGNIGTVQYFELGCWPIDTTFYFTAPIGINAKFLRYQLSHINLKQYDSSTATPSLRREDLESVQLIVPPYAEQLRIIVTIEEHFSRLGAGSSLLEKVSQDIRQLRYAVLREMVRGGVACAPDGLERDVSFDVPEFHTLSPRDWPWKIPRSWLWSTIGELFEVFVGFTPKRSTPANWVGDIPWVSSGEVAFNRISKTRETISLAALGNPKTRLHPPGTVLLAMIGEGKTRGQAAILDVAAAHNQNSASIRTSGTGILPEYLYAVLEERYEETRKSASGGNQLALNGSTVRSIPIPVSPLEQQKIIVNYLDDLRVAEDRLRRAVLAGLHQSKALRRKILAYAFSGQLVPRDPNDEPVSMLLKRIKVERTAQPKNRRARRIPRKSGEKRSAL